MAFFFNKIKEKCHTVLLIGESCEYFAQKFKDNDFHNFEIVKHMDKAVRRGREIAKENKVKVVLLSPACASFDQYRSFEHRGDDFREICLDLSSSDR